MSDGKQFKKPWDIWQHGKLQIYGEAWKENKQRPSMKISMWNNNPRFIIYMNNDSATAKKSISFALDTYIAGDLTELMKDCIRKKDPSRVGVELKAKRDHRGGTYEKPTVVAKIFLGRDTDGVMYIAFQAKGEALAKFPMLPSFWAELVGGFDGCEVREQVAVVAVDGRSRFAATTEATGVPALAADRPTSRPKQVDHDHEVLPRKEERQGL